MKETKDATFEKKEKQFFRQDTVEFIHKTTTKEKDKIVACPPPIWTAESGTSNVGGTYCN